MKAVRKTIYVSSDGVEHSTAELARRHENAAELADLLHNCVVFRPDGATVDSLATAKNLLSNPRIRFIIVPESTEKLL